MKSAQDNPGVAIKPPKLYFLSIVLGLGLQWLRPWPLPWGAAGAVIGMLLIVGSITFMLWANREFVRRQTSVNPDYPATAVVTTGPYHYSRNPMYLAFTFVQVGIALTLSTLWPLLTLVPTLLILQFGVIAREEGYMEAKFGQEYKEYKAAVRRWI